MLLTRMHSRRTRTTHSLPYWGLVSVEDPPGQRPPWSLGQWYMLGQRPPGQIPSGQRPSWSCDVWCMLVERHPPCEQNHRHVQKHYIAATSLWAVKMVPTAHNDNRKQNLLVCRTRKILLLFL